MWSVYGNQGVAIKSTIGRIGAVFEKTGRDFIYGRMTYVDYQTGVSTEFNPEQKSDYRLLLRPFFLKRKEYESEQEVRFVTSGADISDRGGILLKELNPQENLFVETSEHSSFIEKGIDEITKKYIQLRKATCYEHIWEEPVNHEYEK